MACVSLGRLLVVGACAAWCVVPAGAMHCGASRARPSVKTRRAPTRAAAVYAQEPMDGPGVAAALNVVGTTLRCCCADVGGSGIGTGFYRDGHCSTGPQDEGSHTVCIVATVDFLDFSKSVGNDLSTPIPAYNFPGVAPGDCWCLCATRWIQALQQGKAPKLKLLATHARALDVVVDESRAPLLSAMRAHAVDSEEADAAVAELESMRSKLEALLPE